MDESMFGDWINGRLGAYPSPIDYRNFRVRCATPYELEELPDEYTELLDYAPTDPWPSQGDIGSCVGHDGAIVMEITNTLYKQYSKLSDIEKPIPIRYIEDDLSAGWLYHWSRHYANVPDYVEGSTNLGLMKALNKEGTALEVDVPTDTVAPWDGIDYSIDDAERAKSYAVDSYWNVNPNPNDVKAAIYGLTHIAPYKMPDDSQGKIPLVTAYPVYQSFSESYDNGIVPMPKPGETLRGGHSSAVIGWKIIDGEEYFVNFNSWGCEVGDGGLFYLPRDYPFYAGDFWLVHNGPVEDDDDEPTDCQVSLKTVDTLNWISDKLRRKTRFKAYVPIVTSQWC